MSAASGVLLPGFIGTTLPGWLAARLRGGLAGVCLFRENIHSLSQLRELTTEILQANPHAVISIDEEGGDVTRLYDDRGSPYPGNAILGRIDDLAYTEAVAASVGRQLRQAGCTITFAPDVDINSNPNNPVIGVRSFGTDPALVARHSAAWIRGLQATGIDASAKHFPGHGDTAQDSHLALPIIDRSLEQLRERELIPFVAAIEAGSATIMTSHILLPQLDPDAPATLSARILQGLLREELGFDGVIVSDAIDMVGASAVTGIPEAAVRALAAGCDLLCIGTDNSDVQLAEIESAILVAVGDGRLPASRLQDAADRVRGLSTGSAAGRETVATADVATADTAEPVFDLALTTSVFDIRSGLVVQPDRHLVAIDTAANIAVGFVPQLPGVDARVREGGRLGRIPAGRQLVLVGRDNHRHAWVRDLIDEARRTHPSVIVVDMGWPGDDRQYADVATFGASAHVGQALHSWFEQTAGITMNNSESEAP